MTDPKPLTADTLSEQEIQDLKEFTERHIDGNIPIIPARYWLRVYATLAERDERIRELAEERDVLRRRIDGFGGWPAMAQDYEQKFKCCREYLDSLTARLAKAKAVVEAARELQAVAGELCDAIDLGAEDIGGHRPSIEIFGELGPAVNKASDVLNAYDAVKEETNT